MLKRFCLIGVILSLSVPLTAQSTWSAERPGGFVWVGAAFSTFNPDYGCNSNSPLSCWGSHAMGITPFATSNAFLFGRIGAEGAAHFLQWHGPNGLKENSYLAGPRFYIYRRKNLRFSGKFLLGAGHLDVPAPQVGSGTYLALAPGAALDYRIAKRMFARVDYEYQYWPSFEGLKNGHSGLTPNGFTIGVAYAVP